MTVNDEKKVLDTIERVSKSVVNLDTERVIRDVFYRAIPAKGMGTGVIIDSQGYILTNNHVIVGAKKIGVALTDGRVLEGVVIGVCTTHDIAVIKINSTNLPALELGDSSKIRAGQRVFAIGNPLALSGGPTVTAGVISAINRSIATDSGMIENLVQTDAAINPGNSGGPLVDLEGRAIAINTAIIPFAQGIGFAIPINEAKQCANDILTHGKMMKPWLGVAGVSVTDDIASYYRLPINTGVLVVQVMTGSPAERAGINPGDIILALDDVNLNRIEQLSNEVKKRTIGQSVTVTLLQGRQKVKIEVVLAKTP